MSPAGFSRNTPPLVSILGSQRTKEQTNCCCHCLVQGRFSGGEVGFWKTRKVGGACGGSADLPAHHPCVSPFGRCAIWTILHNNDSLTRCLSTVSNEASSPPIDCLYAISYRKSQCDVSVHQNRTKWTSRAGRSRTSSSSQAKHCLAIDREHLFGSRTRLRTGTRAGEPGPTAAGTSHRSI